MKQIFRKNKLTKVSMKFNKQNVLLKYKLFTFVIKQIKQYVS